MKFLSFIFLFYSTLSFLAARSAPVPRSPAPSPLSSRLQCARDRCGTPLQDGGRFIRWVVASSSFFQLSEQNSFNLRVTYKLRLGVGSPVETGRDCLLGRLKQTSMIIPRGRLGNIFRIESSRSFSDSALGRRDTHNYDFQEQRESSHEPRSVGQSS